MKKVLLLVISALVIGGIANAKQSEKETIKERKEYAKYTKDQLNQKAGKDARKAARDYAKEGWKVAPGQLPLDKQLDRSYLMKYEFDESGLPKWIEGDAMSPGSTYDAAKNQALVLAKQNLAGQIQTEVTALMESTVGNEQINQKDAASIAKTISSSKSLIAQKIGRTVTVIECYRELPNNGCEVRVTVAYNAKMAIDDAKSVIKKQLEEQGEDLHKQLDTIWGQYGK